MAGPVPFTTSAIVRLSEYASMKMIDASQAEAIGKMLRSNYENSIRPAIDEQDVDYAVLFVCYETGDCQSGMGCEWEYGQKPGMLWGERKRTRNCRSVTFKVGNLVQRGRYTARVLDIDGPWLMVGQVGWPLLQWHREDCRLV